jgi:drug/metabolite transporter (DMT)-like permease
MRSMQAAVEKSSTTDDHAGAGKMTTARLLVFLAAFLFGLFVIAYRYHGAAIDAYLHISHLHPQDWLLLIFGSGCVGGIVYNFLNDPDTLDWRGSFWLIIGGLMIYAELGNVLWLKEGTCWMITRYHADQYCSSQAFQ